MNTRPKANPTAPATRTTATGAVRRWTRAVVPAGCDTSVPPVDPDDPAAERRRPAQVADHLVRVRGHVEGVVAGHGPGRIRGPDDRPGESFHVAVAQQVGRLDPSPVLARRLTGAATE